MLQSNCSTNCATEVRDRTWVTLKCLRRRLDRAGCVILFACSFIACGPATGSDSTVVTSDDSTTSVTVRRLADDNTEEFAEYTLQLEIIDHMRLEPRLLDLPPTFESVTRVILHDQTIVVTGEMPMSAGSILWTIHRRQSERQRLTRCYTPVMSPNEELVCFQNWFPRSGMPEERRIGVSILDLTQTEFPATQVFPINPPRADSDNVNAAVPGRRVHWPVSPFAWSAGGRIVCFVDRFSEWGKLAGEGECTVVFVRMSRRPDSVQFATVTLNPAANAKSGTPPEDVRFSVESIEWIGDEAIQLHLYPQSYWEKSAIIVEVPEAFYPKTATGVPDSIDERE